MSRGKSRVLALIVALTASACHAAGPGQPVPRANLPFVGSWRFVSGTYTQPDGSVSRADSTQLQLLKVIGPTDFAYVTQATLPRFIRASAGSYTVADGKYAEKIVLTSQDNMRGNTYPFAYRFDGDTWYHTGFVNGVKIEEVYRRVR